MTQVSAQNNVPIIPAGVKELKFASDLKDVKVLKVEPKGASVSGLQGVTDNDVVFVIGDKQMYNAGNLNDQQVQEALKSKSVSDLTANLQKMSA